MRYDSNKPYCGFDNVNDLSADLETALKNAFFIPNEMLSPEYQNHKEECGPSAIQFEKKYNKIHAEKREQSKAQREKQERTNRIDKMADQYDVNESFEYDEDEARLHRNMVAFCSAAQLIDQDDIDEQNFFGGE